MNTAVRQLEAEVEAILDAEQEVAQETAHQNVLFEQRQQNTNMGRNTPTQNDVHQHIRNAFKPDGTYKSAWKKFTKFVKEKRINGEIEIGLKFITRFSVDLFFRSCFKNECYT